MNINKNTQYLIGGIVIILIAGFFLFSSSSVNDSGQQNKETSNQTQNEGESTSEEETKLGMLEGILQISDDLKQGNLMLETADKKIYIFTSRDYSELFGQEVKVEIEGSMDSFTLINIAKK